MKARNKIYQEGALKGLKEIKNDAADIIIVDPPYNIGKKFGNNGGERKKISDYVDWCKKWLKESYRILKKDGTIYIYGFSENLAHISTQIPLERQRWLVWHYTNKTTPALDFWQRSHESILCTWKGSDRPRFNKDEVRVPYTESFKNNSAGKKRKGTKGRFGNKETTYNAHPNGALPRDVINASALAGGAGRRERWFMCKDCEEVYPPDLIDEHRNHEIEKHPTQKPLELSEKLIKAGKPKNKGIVVVPFVGSGSECVAAKKLGLSYIGFEINPNYIRIAQARIDNIRSSQSLGI